MRVLGIFAHPDDETLFAGGTLAAYALDGCAVHTVTLTGGEAAEHIDDLAEAARRRLARFRRACDALGIGGSAYRPGHWRDLGHQAADGTLALAELDSVVAAVAALLDERRPDLVVTVGSDGVTGHPDHVRAHQAVVGAVEGRPGLRVLAGCVRRTDVTEARGDRAYAGGVHGVESEPLEVVLPAEAVEAKRRALSAYYPAGAGASDGRGEDRDDGGDPIGDVELLLGIARLHDDRREFFENPAAAGELSPLQC